MPYFSKRNGVYEARNITGPRSVLLRLELGAERSERPHVTVLRPDARFGDPDPDAVRAAVLSGTDEANATFGTAYHPRVVQYAVDNDRPAHLLRRAAWAIVERLAERGESGFEGYGERA